MAENETTDNDLEFTLEKSVGEEEDDLDLPNKEGIFIQAYDLVESLAANEDSESLESTASDVALKKHRRRKAAREATTTNGKCMLSPENGYKLGDAVRATYDVDGIDYEATIVSIDDGAGTCTVRFIGYGNEQEVALSDLVASWGVKARRLQVTTANAPEEQKASNTPKCSNRPIQTRKTGKTRHPTAPLPPPPIPPEFDLQLNAANAKLLSSMLVSWYMTGYYTGIYQGRMMSAQDAVSKTRPQSKGKKNASKKNPSK